MTREQALPYVSHVLDDALGACTVNMREIRDDARLVGWQCGFEPMFVAVQSYLRGVVIDDGDAEEIATDYLTEIGWFGDEPREPDYII